MIEPVIVELSWRDVHMAGGVAVSRTVDNLSKGRKDAHGLVYDGLGIEQHWLGTIGEIAVAKHIDRYWDPLRLGVVDVGSVEVRTVDAAHKRLMLHESDRDDLPWVSALVERLRLPRVTLRGWILGKDGKNSEYWLDPTGARPAFFIPTNRLLPMGALPRSTGDSDDF